MERTTAKGYCSYPGLFPFYWHLKNLRCFNAIQCKELPESLGLKAGRWLRLALSLEWDKEPDQNLGCHRADLSNANLYGSSNFHRWSPSCFLLPYVKSMRTVACYKPLAPNPASPEVILSALG
jgi:hypothetical protein